MFSRNKGVVADGLCVISSAKESYKPSLKIRIDMYLKRRAHWFSFTTLSPDFSFPGLSGSAKQTTGVLLLALISLSVSSAHAASPFTTEGKFSVGSDGSANYSIPIVVPPGTAGMQPQLALNYNSNGGNGIVGMGWGIDGLSQISRCPTTLEQDNVINGVNYTSTDRFCLDGQRLIATTDSYVTHPTDSTRKIYTTTSAYGANGTEYRTESANFAKIISYGQAGTGPAYFKVWTKSGQIIEYGNTVDSGIEAQGKPTIRTWGVNKISDTKGNYIAVTYTEDNANGEAYVQKIDYTGNAASTPTVTPYANIQFIYEARPDTNTAYQAGSVLKTTKRLTNIQTFNATTLIKNYKLTYELSQTTNRSRLKTLTECDGNNTTSNCKEPLSIILQTRVDSFSGWQQWGSTSAVNSLVLINCRSLSMTDINGDGLPDEVCAYRYDSGAETVFVKVNTGTSLTGWQQWGGVGGANSVALSSCTSLEITDLNGDGLPDEVCAYNYGSGSETTLVKLNMGTSLSGWQQWGSTSAVNSLVLTNCRSLSMTDINGDGLPDEVCAYRYDSGAETVFVKVNTGTSLTGWQQWGGVGGANSVALSSCTSLEITDLNGDGLPDEVCAYNYGSGSETTLVKLNTGTSLSGWQQWGSTSAVNSLVLTNCRSLSMTDINGDGLPDEVCAYRYDSGAETVFVKVNTGTSLTGWQQWGGVGAANSVALSSCTSLEITDVNGDGLPDEVCAYRYDSGAETVFVKVNTGTSLTGWQQWGGVGSASSMALSSCTSLEITDVNGDGLPDEVCAYNYGSGSETTFVKIASTPYPGFLTSLLVGNPLSKISIGYQSLIAPNVHLKDRGSIYPIRDVQGPMYVVTTTTVSDAIGGVLITNYQFGGLKSHLRGRGSLGFRYVKESSPDSGISVTTFYRQDFPFTGLPSQVEKHRLSDNALLSVVLNTYANTDLATGTMLSKFSYLSQSVEQVFELDDSLVSTTTTTNQYDGYGNVTSVKVDDGLGNTKTTTSTYKNDVGNWLLGRLIRSTVTSVTP